MDEPPVSKGALEVTAYTGADLLLSVLGVTGGGTATVSIITGMQTDTDDGWVNAGSFNAVTGANFHDKLHVKELLKYIRYEVTGMTFTDITLQIGGVLRVNG